MLSTCIYTALEHHMALASLFWKVSSSKFQLPSPRYHFAFTHAASIFILRMLAGTSGVLSFLNCHKKDLWDADILNTGKTQKAPDFKEPTS